MASRHEKARSVTLESIPRIQPGELTLYEGGQVERGSFGDVKKAKWRGVDVAVKLFIVADKKGGISEEIAGFSLVHGHPNIIHFYGAHIIPASLDDRPFIVMEFAQYSLGKVLHEKRSLTYTVDHVMNWSLQMANALEFVHRQDVLHRDIKPSNILLFQDGRLLKLCDFGTARKLQHTLTNAVGTVLYMAPEVIKSTNYTPNCDVYSFGVVLWEMITRCKPFIVGMREKGIPVHSIMFKIAGGGRPPMIKDLPQCLKDLLNLCWNDDFTKRPSMAEIRIKLSKLSERVNLHLDVPLMKRRVVRKVASVPPLMSPPDIRRPVGTQQSAYYYPSP